MPTEPTPISPLSTPPSSSDPANFRARGDAFFGDLPDFQTEANALAENVYENAVEAEASAALALESKDVAVAAANYKGDYDPGRTYAQGESVSEGSIFYASKSDNNLDNTPSATPASWKAILIIPNQVTLTTENADASYPLVFAETPSAGDQGLKVAPAGGTYNPSTNTASLNISGNAATASDAALLGGQDSDYYRNASNINAGTLSALRLPATINSDTSGNAATADDAALFNGQDSAYYRNASNVNAGTLSVARLPATINSDTTGNAATATTAGSATTAANADKLGGVVPANYARTDINETFNGDVTITGALILSGPTTEVQSQVTTLDDPVITLADNTSVNDGKDRGTEYKWHDGSGVKTGFFGLDRSTGMWTFIPDATNTAEVFSGTPGMLDVAGITGNAGTASALQTARDITLNGDVSGSASFDGSANITITVTIADDSHNHVFANLSDGMQSVLDIAGGMVTGNTEDGLTASYNEINGTIDLFNTDKGSTAVAAHEADPDPHPQYSGGGQQFAHDFGTANGTINLDFSQYTAFHLDADGDVVFTLSGLPADKRVLGALNIEVYGQDISVEFSGDFVEDFSAATPKTVGCVGAATAYSGNAFTDGLINSDIYMKPDRTLMFGLDSGNKRVRAYSLSAAGDPSTASLLTTFYIGGQVSAPSSLDFSDDGTKFYVFCTTNDAVYQYDLTAWDIDTAAYTTSLSVGAQTSSPKSAKIAGNGKGLIVFSSTSAWNYSLAGDVDTATYLSNYSLYSNFPAIAILDNAYLSRDGKRLAVLDKLEVKVHILKLGAPNIVANPTYLEAIDMSTFGVHNTPFFKGITFGNDEKQMYVLDTSGTGGDVFGYDGTYKSIYAFTLSQLSDSEVVVKH